MTQLCMRLSTVSRCFLMLVLIMLIYGIDPSSSDEKAYGGDSGDQGQRSGDVEGQQATMWRLGYYDPYGRHYSMANWTNISTSAPK